MTFELPRLRCFRPEGNPERKGLLIGDFSTTTACNANCVGCYTNAGRLAQAERRKLGRSFLDFEAREALLDELDPYIRTLVLSGLGDATFQHWPENQKLIDRAIEKGIEVCLFTNGILMDDRMADWIAARPRVSVIGKWLHADPATNERLLGLPAGASGEYVEQESAYLPWHIHALMARGLHEQSRLSVAATMLQSNRPVAASMWRWLREHGVIPNFSWLVPTPGMGMQAKMELQEDLSPAQREELTRECWHVDQQLGYPWKFCMGPRITSNRCGDEYLIYFGTFGDVRLCPSSHNPPLGYWPDMGVAELLDCKAALEKQIASVRRSVDNQPSCICAAGCEGSTDAIQLVNLRFKPSIGQKAEE